MAEKPSRPQSAESATTSQTALTGVRVRGLMARQWRDPGSAASRAKAKTTRDASTSCAAPQRNYSARCI